MSTYLTTGFVLRSRAFREADRLYTLYTKDRGKLQLLAAGSLKLASKLAPNMQTFAEVEVMIARGRERDRLAAAKLTSHYLKPPYHLPSALLGTAFLEVVNQLTSEEQPDPRIYELLQQSLTSVSDLEEAGGDWRPRARLRLAHFVLEALKLSGLAVFISRCEHCQREYGEPNQPLEFSWSRHGVFHQSCTEAGEQRLPLPPAVFRWLQSATAGAEQTEALPAGTLAFITDYLSGQTGRELYTLKVLRSIL
jgi:DNA repair protein RecO (recombination protein O)